jgi:Cupin domain
MSEVRHMAVAPTGVQHLAGGDTIDRHRHDDHQLVYVSTGVLAVQTAAGSWVASPDLAVWLPAGTWHEHRFYGTSVFHTVSFPADRPPLPDHAPTIVAVSGLLHELLVACTDPALTPAQERRVRAVIRDQLQYTRQEPISLPTPVTHGSPRPARSPPAESLNPSAWPAWLSRSEPASARSHAFSAPS